jgi:hypothetical protein
VLEASPQQLATTGAWGGAGYDPVDRDLNYRRSGAGRREVPYWTRERAVAASVAAYRMNPMATAIIDTYTAFCVGDSGLTYMCTNEDVRQVVAEFWDDPRNKVGDIQDLWLRTQLLLGEMPIEVMVGEQSGVVRFCPMDPAQIDNVELLQGNPMWPHKLILGGTGDDGERRTLDIVHADSGLREGQAMYWAPFKTLASDVRGMPFLTSVLDDLDAYDQVISNLVDRTALARYLVWDVTVVGGQTEVDNYVNARGGMHIPPSGSVEVHNESVTWEPKSAPSGAAEDTQAAGAVLTKVAGGAGLAKTWLAEPDGANRATSLTMAEPVRRRVGGVQKLWLNQMTELVRFAVDRAVAAKRLPEMVEASDPKTGAASEQKASQSVIVTGPEVAAADAQITAQVLLNLATSLTQMVDAGVLTVDAAALAAKKGWEDYMGIPYRAELDSPEANVDDLAEVAEVAESARVRQLRPA